MSIENLNIYRVRRFDFSEVTIDYYVKAKDKIDAALLGYYITEQHNTFKKNAPMEFHVEQVDLPYQYDGILYTWEDIVVTSEYRDFEQAVLYLDSGERLVFKNNEEARQYMDKQSYNYDFYSTNVLKDSKLVGVIYGQWRKEDTEFMRRNLNSRWFN